MCNRVPVWVAIACAPLAALDISVPAGGDLQNAFNIAVPGDRIILPAGAAFKGTFTLPYNGSAAGWITIQTANLNALPPEGSRVTPQDAVNMPAILEDSPFFPAITATNGANHYRFVGIEIKSIPGAYSLDLIRIGTSYETTVGALPHHFDFDRSYIHGDADWGAKRGIALNGLYISVRNSYLADFKSNWQDTQALMGWNGPGPFLIQNNFLEAAGETVIFGGATSAIAGLVPSNIVIRGNYFFKPFSWYSQSPAYDGKAWVAKNHFELKNGSNVTVDGNIFQNCWPSDQRGFAVQLTVRTESGTMPWAVVQDVTFTHNIIQDAAGGINILGLDDSSGVTGAAQRITIRDNIFNTTAPVLNGIERLFQVLNGAQNVVIDHNTGFPADYTMFLYYLPSTNLSYTNNLTSHSVNGIWGGGPSEGLGALREFAPGSVVAHNVLVGTKASAYPGNNFFPADLASVGFNGVMNGDYSLMSASPYHLAGSDGKDIGVDVTALKAATATAISGQTASYVTPSAFDLPAPAVQQTCHQVGCPVPALDPSGSTPFENPRAKPRFRPLSRAQ